MKKTLKQLQQELDEMQNDRDKYYSKYNELREEKNKNQYNEMMILSSKKNELENQIRNLLEIVRWLIKPNTAESPFMPTKNRGDNERHFNP